MDNQNEVFANAQVAVLSAQRNAAMDSVSVLAGKLSVSDALLAESMSKLKDVTEKYDALLKRATEPQVPTVADPQA